jgi:prepilin-type N-terminal cleavage/methylation domain-containing protein/prepilin-type processing-associated H-X9-DG protein
MPRRCRHAFTLIELLVVVAIIALLISILIPSLSRARTLAKSTVCNTRLRTLGQGLVLYANANRDVLPPCRMPAMGNTQVRMKIVGGEKYRPTFLALMGDLVGLKPFDDPKPTKTDIDMFGQPGDRQNYANVAYICSETPEWTDERNGSYGYNYQFLGNARLTDEQDADSYKNWPVPLSRIKSPAGCVAVGDSMGTAATFSRHERRPYQDNIWDSSGSGRDLNAFGNEGFNLDPPRVDETRGEMAGFGGDHAVRTSVHMRHAEKGNVLWLDGHASSETDKSLGYQVDEETGVIGFEGNNKLFSADHVDKPWIQK